MPSGGYESWGFLASLIELERRPQGLQGLQGSRKGARAVLETEA